MSFLPDLFSSLPVKKNPTKLPKLTRGDVEAAATFMEKSGDLLIGGGQILKEGGKILKDASKGFPDK